jgi:hypothetical protein
MEKRFLVIERMHDPETDKDEFSMHVRDNEYVSDRIDMADCYDGAAEIFYLTTDGKLEPVTVGQTTRHPYDDDSNPPFRFASAPLIAGGNVVGSVTYTDH